MDLATLVCGNTSMKGTLSLWLQRFSSSSVFPTTFWEKNQNIINTTVILIYIFFSAEIICWLHMIKDTFNTSDSQRSSSLWQISIQICLDMVCLKVEDKSASQGRSFLLEMSNAVIISIYATSRLKLSPQIFTVHASEIAGSYPGLVRVKTQVLLTSSTTLH